MILIPGASNKRAGENRKVTYNQQILVFPIMNSSTVSLIIKYYEIFSKLLQEEKCMVVSHFNFWNLKNNEGYYNLHQCGYQHFFYSVLK